MVIDSNDKNKSSKRRHEAKEENKRNGEKINAKDELIYLILFACVTETLAVSLT